jgi:hypothetical protein
MEEHFTCEHVGYSEYNQMEHTMEKCRCPGGVREEVVIDYELAVASVRGLMKVWEIFGPLDAEQLREHTRLIVVAALKSAGFTKKFASEEPSTE